MRTHEALAELLNVSTEYTFNGKKYKLGEATIQQRAEYSNFVIQATYNDVETRRKNGLSDEAYAFTLKGIAGDVGAQKYEFEGEMCLAAMRQPAGQIAYLYIMLRDEYPEVTEEVAREMYKAKIREVQPALEKVRNDPKALRGLADLLLGGMPFNGSVTGRRTQSPMKKSSVKRRRK